MLIIPSLFFDADLIVDAGVHFDFDVDIDVELNPLGTLP